MAEQSFQLAKRRNLPRFKRLVLSVNEQRPNACGCGSGNIFHGAVADVHHVFRRDAQFFGRVLKYHR